MNELIFYVSLAFSVSKNISGKTRLRSPCGLSSTRCVNRSWMPIATADARKLADDICVLSKVKLGFPHPRFLLPSPGVCRYDSVPETTPRLGRVTPPRRRPSFEMIPRMKGLVSPPVTYRGRARNRSSPTMHKPRLEGTTRTQNDHL